MTSGVTQETDITKRRIAVAIDECAPHTIGVIGTHSPVSTERICPSGQGIGAALLRQRRGDQECLKGKGEDKDGTGHCSSSSAVE